MGGGGGPSSLNFLQGVCLGGGVKCLIYFLDGGGESSGQPGNPSGYALASDMHVSNSVQTEHV